jgi:UPF0755 protein
LKILRRIVLVLALAAAAGGAWLWLMLAQPYQSFPREGVFVDVPRGASVRAIAGLLEARGVVRKAAAFEALARWRGQSLQAGEYFFDQPRTADEVRRMLAEGRTFVQTLAVREGATLAEIAVLVEKAGLTTRAAFLEVAHNPSPVRDIAPRARNLEGFLFPATYQFPRRAAAGDIVGAMVRRFREVWNALPERQALPRGFSVEQVVTMASLVERETGIAGERAVISGVFHNRLRRGMPLECDPTVIYALELAGRYRGSLARTDLRFDSPYNTYRRRGLPPGPIANPGEAALRAALSPAQTEYLFFVADAQGGHLFSRTLREHNANVARYRRLQAEAARGRSGG